MDPLEKLIAIEEIRQLLSRRTRLIDGKHWEKLVEVYTDDVVGHHLGVKGGRAVVEHVRKVLEGVRTIHQLHLPEIEITGSLTARGIVPMEDLLLWEEDGVKRWVHGYGHYHQRYVKTDRGWLIDDHKLTRQYLREGYGDFDPSSGSAALTERYDAPVVPLPADLT
ncbi:nuclear transport factor 2 family protein [Nocardia sp. BSTN01]|uniref:nuclear transport factor 2 family protein n=1 Tax=Nocardia sp. BSTN01 TaxID=2783665 RepID=UPI00188F15AD|nr:nuclear transport factor 2 family protein [Nocardia sp. BSTN01]MBF4999667.1 nuclear transport factor 2 family protein [Nocardia sp. BSTN01]